jgi:hypothetical protein
MVATNTHPVDELADIRAKIKLLEEREAELRAVLLAGECSLVGGTHVAWIAEQEQTRLDTVAARKALGEEVLAPFTVVQRVRQVRLSVRSEKAA